MNERLEYEIEHVIAEIQKRKEKQLKIDGEIAELTDKLDYLCKQRDTNL